MSEQDFKDIVMKYQDRVFNTCLGFLKNTQYAEDVAQEVFIKIYQTHDTFLGQSALETWIYRIAVNQCLQEIRKQKAQKRPQQVNTTDSIPEAESFDHPGVDLENKERAMILFSAINQLPENQKVAFTLHKIDGLDHNSISSIMDKSISSVESLIHRAKQNLQKSLKDYYYETTHA